MKSISSYKVTLLIRHRVQMLIINTNVISKELNFVLDHSVSIFGTVCDSAIIGSI